MTRRKAKKAFKKKWSASGRIALFKTVPNKWSPRAADRFNAHAETEIKKAMFKAMDEAILYGTGVKRPDPGPEPVGLGRSAVTMMVDEGLIPVIVGEIITHNEG